MNGIILASSFACSMFGGTIYTNSHAECEALKARTLYLQSWGICEYPGGGRMDMAVSQCLQTGGRMKPGSIDTTRPPSPGIGAPDNVWRSL